MKKIVIFIVICTNILFAFDAKDLQSLKEYGYCTQCDLSYATFKNSNIIGIPK